MRRPNEIRIIGGTLRGRAIRTLPGLAARPTRALVREALFDILGGQISGARVLDLFAGSGALGLEALSRGAAHATFVESNRRLLAMLGQQLEQLVPRERWQCLGADAMTLSASMLGRRPIDIVFLDPPYALWSQGALARQLFANLASLVHEAALAPTVQLIVEAERAAVLNHAAAAFATVDERAYGRSCLLFLQATQQSV